MITTPGSDRRRSFSANAVRWRTAAVSEASFIDTPVSEQAEIAAFCARALESLPPVKR